jgi:RimJ/RimL family protein N-acetyltransferase
MKNTSSNNYTFMGLPNDRINELDELHRLIREGRGLNFWRKIFFRIQGRKVCGIAINAQDQLVGFTYYYFRESELVGMIIHEAFIGISPNERGKGIATALQRYALDHLAKQQLIGVSANIEKTNLPSIRIHQRAGFQFSDDPQDPTNYKVYYELITHS